MADASEEIRQKIKYKQGSRKKDQSKEIYSPELFQTKVINNLLARPPDFQLGLNERGDI